MGSSLKKGWSQAGYDLEEAYFFLKDRELIEKQKQRPKLELIQGGGQGTKKSDRPAMHAASGKKAA